MTQKQHQIIISLASNENQETNLQAAREQLTQLLSEVHFTSAIWTDPINSIRQEPYLNQLCKANTAFSMNLLSEVLKETEKRLGRTHNEDGIVTIDLDLLQYDEEQYHLRDWSRIYVKNLIKEL
jgi:2-amino-4-hydroxy-6-hydroxymethyldihydropteridine diphosphokinase